MKCFKSIIFFLSILCVAQISLACTIFNMSNDTVVLVGNNEDYYLTSNIWFTPPTDSSYGRITFGFNNGWSQGGVNDQGLFFDWAATTSTGWQFSYEKDVYEDTSIRDSYQICEMIMAKCASIDEVIEVFNDYNVFSLRRSHPMFVDQTGASAVIEWNHDGLTVHRKDKEFQVLTNFNLSDHNIGWYPCWRYDLASSMLSNSGRPKVELFRTILDTVHQEGKYYTLYSNIYDLKNRDLFVFNKHNFDEYLKINVLDELTKGDRAFTLSALFSEIKMKSKGQSCPFHRYCVAQLARSRRCV